MSNKLRYDVTSTQTLLYLESVSDFPVNGGIVTIDSEQISYTTATDNSLVGSVRGVNSTSPASHTAGTVVSLNAPIPVVGLDMEGERIVNLADPVNDQDAATKDYVDDSSGGGTPAGSNTQIQFNNSGAFGASSSLTWNGNNLDITGGSSLGNILITNQVNIESQENPHVNIGQLADDGNQNIAIFTAFPLGNIILGSNHVCLTQSTGTADSSAILDVQSTNEGFLPPRMTTTQKNAIASPAEGLIVYDLTLHKLSLWTGSTWETVTSS